MQELSNAKLTIEKLVKNIAKAVVGKEDVIRPAITALLADGHILLEDVPGVGKTLLAKSIARSIDASFKRIQFTSDLLPSDITGVSVYNQRNNEFEYIQGPIFANIVLADEINRGTPRTQSSLLESMEERQVSVDGITRLLPKPFFVIGTQNPIESQGTFPLPDSQVDRFLMSLSVGYPSIEFEAQMLSIHSHKKSLTENVDTIINIDEIRKLQDIVYKIEATDEIYSYIVKIVNETRNHNDIMLGASPRASVAMLMCAKSNALMEGRDYVTPDDVKSIVPYVLAHRLIPYRAMNRKQILNVIEGLMKKVTV